jgi:hypothetical protein
VPAIIEGLKDGKGRAVFHGIPRPSLTTVVSFDDNEAGRLRIEEVRIIASPDADEPIDIRAVDLRSIALGELVRGAAAQLRAAGAPQDEVTAAARWYGIFAREGVKDVLGEVARVMRVSRSTAAVRVREARTAGYLPARQRRKLPPGG